MKKIVLALFLLSTLTVFGQASFEKDTTIAHLQKNLPMGWTLTHTDTLIVIKRNNPVYQVPANHINEPMYMHNEDSMTTDNDKPPVGAKMVEMKFVCSYKPRWEGSKYLAALKHNDSLNEKIDHLRKQRKGGGTIYKTKGKKGQMVKIQGDPVVDRFNENLGNEIFTLEKQKIDVPSYCSQYYFLTEYNTYYCIYPAGDDPRYYSIFPTQAEQELNSIQDYIHDNCSAYAAYHTSKK